MTGKDRPPAENEMRISLHGPNVRYEDAIESAEAMKSLIEAVSEAQTGEKVGVEIAWMGFVCDGCGRERPKEHGDWINDGTDDFCPACAVAGSRKHRANGEVDAAPGATPLGPACGSPEDGS